MVALDRSVMDALSGIHSAVSPYCALGVWTLPTEIRVFFSNLSRFSLISQFLDYSHLPSFVCLPNPPNTFRV